MLKYTHSTMNTRRIICKFFLSGTCKFGSDCRFSHEVKALTGTKTRRPCRDFLQCGYCMKDDRNMCIFDHIKKEDLTEDEKLRIKRQQEKIAENAAADKKRLEKFQAEKEKIDAEKSAARRKEAGQKRAERMRAIFTKEHAEHPIAKRVFGLRKVVFVGGRLGNRFALDKENMSIIFFRNCSWGGEYSTHSEDVVKESLKGYLGETGQIALKNIGAELILTSMIVWRLFPNSEPREFKDPVEALMAEEFSEFATLRSTGLLKFKEKKAFEEAAEKLALEPGFIPS